MPRQAMSPPWVDLRHGKPYKGTSHMAVDRRTVERSGMKARVIDQASNVSGLLQAWGRGDLEARDALFPQVYRELRRLAAAYLRRERPDHTLPPTALVHEAYLRLVGQRRVAWQNRAQFFGVAAQMMRRVLVDHARERQATKRGGGEIRVVLDDAIGAAYPRDCDMLLLDQALTELTDRDARLAQIVELRYFAGLSEQEVAAALSLSRATVTRDWQTARAWLYRRLTTGAKGPAR
jgi:RNA polymerase sigma factor (TIGR02999 family)